MLLRLNDAEICNKDCIEYIRIDETDNQVYAVIKDRLYNRSYRVDIGIPFSSKPNAEEFLDLLWFAVNHTEDDRDGTLNILNLLDAYLKKRIV